MKRQRSVAGRATTCWRACLITGESENRLAIKDSWEYEERPEGLLLKEATEAEVENVARYHEIVHVGGIVDVASPSLVQHSRHHLWNRYYTCIKISRSTTKPYEQHTNRS